MNSRWTVRRILGLLAVSLGVTYLWSVGVAVALFGLGPDAALGPVTFTLIGIWVILPACVLAYSWLPGWVRECTPVIAATRGALFGGVAGAASPWLLLTGAVLVGWLLDDSGTPIEAPSIYVGLDRIWRLLAPISGGAALMGASLCGLYAFRVVRPDGGLYRRVINWTIPFTALFLFYLGHLLATAGVIWNLPVYDEAEAYEVYRAIPLDELVPYGRDDDYSLSPELIVTQHPPMTLPCVTVEGKKLTTTGWDHAASELEKKSKRTLRLSSSFHEAWRDRVEEAAPAALWEFRRRTEIRVSAVGFNETNDKALLAIEHHCGQLCGSAHVLEFEKDEGQWKRVHGPRALCVTWY